MSLDDLTEAAVEYQQHRFHPDAREHLRNEMGSLIRDEPDTSYADLSTFKNIFSSFEPWLIYDVISILYNARQDRTLYSSHYESWNKEHVDAAWSASLQETLSKTAADVRTALPLSGDHISQNDFPSAHKAQILYSLQRDVLDYLQPSGEHAGSRIESVYRNLGLFINDLDTLDEVSHLFPVEARYFGVLCTALARAGTVKPDELSVHLLALGDHPEGARSLLNAASAFSEDSFTYQDIFWKHPYSLHVAQTALQNGRDPLDFQHLLVGSLGTLTSNATRLHPESLEPLQDTDELKAAQAYVLGSMIDPSHTLLLRAIDILTLLNVPTNAISPSLINDYFTSLQRQERHTEEDTTRSQRFSELITAPSSNSFALLYSSNPCSAKHAEQYMQALQTITHKGLSAQEQVTPYLPLLFSPHVSEEAKQILAFTLTTENWIHYLSELSEPAVPLYGLNSTHEGWFVVHPDKAQEGAYRKLREGYSKARLLIELYNHIPKRDIPHALRTLTAIERTVNDSHHGLTSQSGFLFNEEITSLLGSELPEDDFRENVSHITPYHILDEPQTDRSEQPLNPLHLFFQIAYQGNHRKLRDAGIQLLGNYVGDMMSDAFPVVSLAQQLDTTEEEILDLRQDALRAIASNKNVSRLNRNEASKHLSLRDMLLYGTWV